MKICVISPGVVHAVPRTVAIADQFDEVHFIDMAGNADSSKLVSKGVVYHSAREVGKAIKNNRDLQRLFREISPDVIVCHYASGDHFFNAIAYGKCPVAVIAMGHDVFYDAGDMVVPPFARLLTRMALRRSLYISAKSELLGKRIKSYGVHTQVDVNYWGADLDRFSPGDRLEARRKLGLDENAIIILSSRAIEPRLNIHLIVEAFYTVLQRHKRASLVILGRSSPDYKRQVEETVGRLNLKDHVHILGDVSQDSLLQYYQASDVVISVAQSEGFPNTALEVMACKVPIVIGNIPHIDELLEKNRNAWICEKEPGAIATAVLDILGDEENRLRISEAAYATAKEFADIKKNGISFSNKLKQVCGEAMQRHESILSVMIFKVMYSLYRIQRRLVQN